MSPEQPDAPERSGWELGPGDDITDRFTAMELLGGGFSYEVYLAQDARRLALVVVKLLRPHLVDDRRERRSLRREVDALNRLVHPVIVRCLDADMDGERPYIVLEHLEGPHLSRLIRRYPLALEQILPLAVQVCSAIHYMAEERLVHLDVKPRNIIMGAPPRLIDLSVARTFEDASRIKGAIGTDAYMAPEQCDPSRGLIAAPADVWGVGATLYHALARRHPFPRPEAFDRDDPVQRWPQLQNPPDPLPENVPPALGDAVMECLDPTPENRPVAAEVVARLEPLIAELPSRPVLRRLRPRLTRRRQ